MKQHKFDVGTLVLKKVMLNTKDRSDEALGLNWDDSYLIIGIIRPGAYVLEDKHDKAMWHTWNVEHLRMYYT